MGYEAYIKVNCERYSERILDIIMLLKKIEWNIYNNDGLIEYLPIGDIDDFDWQCSNISENDLYDIINFKQSHNEYIGIHLFYNYMESGISFIANSTKEVMMNLNLYRKTNTDNSTDFSWYFNNLILPLRENGCKIDNFTFEEYVD